MCDRFPRQFDVQTSHKPSNYVCCEHQISSGNLSHDSAFDRRTLLFKDVNNWQWEKKVRNVAVRQSVGHMMHIYHSAAESCVQGENKDPSFGDCFCAGG